MGELQKLRVAREHGKAGGEHAALALAEHLARAAQFHVLFGDLKAVRGLGEQAQPLGRLGDEEAPRSVFSAPHAAAQLVQLGKAEALGVFDDHDAGVGHVDAHFHHRGGNEYVRFADAKSLKARVLFRRLHAAVDEG